MQMDMRAAIIRPCATNSRRLKTNFATPARADFLLAPIKCRRRFGLRQRRRRRRRLFYLADFTFPFHFMATLAELPMVCT